MSQRRAAVIITYAAALATQRTSMWAILKGYHGGESQLVYPRSRGYGLTW